MRKLWKKLAPWLLLLAILAGLTWAFWPRPHWVDVAPVTTGPMQVSIVEEGETRLRDRYLITSPLGGLISRIDLDPGDPIASGATIATIEPTDPALLDPRALAEARARVRAAEAALAMADPQVRLAVAAHDLALANLTRLRNALQDAAAADQELDEAVATERIRAEELEAARFAKTLAEYDLEVARAALVRTTPPVANPSGTASSNPDEDLGPFPVRSPIDGRVLRRFRESAGIVAAGESLVEVGDPRDLEVVVDVLSSDAVQIEAGDLVLLEHWGGGDALRAIVRHVEPSGFLKISALGVEEQRVNVIVDFPEASPPPASLGDGFRVEARIVIWEEPQVITAPNGALFRMGNEWAAFVVEGDAAVRRTVRLGRRNDTVSQVLEGLAPGDVLIMHPGDAIVDGAKVRVRE